MHIDRTAGNVHDNEGFTPKSFEPGVLYIWDLGYNDYDRVVKAHHAGALVLKRLESGANPIAIASYGEGSARREILDADGARVRLEAACACGLVHRRRVLDLDVEITGDNGDTIVARVVCVPFGGEDRDYLTTLPQEIFTPYDVAELYRLRWELESRPWQKEVARTLIDPQRRRGPLAKLRPSQIGRTPKAIAEGGQGKR